MKYVLRKFSTDIKYEIILKLKNEIKLNYNMNDDILNFITKQSVINVMADRCKDLGYYPSQAKILGDNNLWNENSVWADIKDDSKFIDLYIRDAEKFFLIKEIFKSFYIDNKENEILEIIQNNNFESVKDLKLFIKNLF
jgi:hypothetical protein